MTGPLRVSGWLEALSALRQRGVDVAHLVPTIVNHDCFGCTLWVTDVSDGGAPRHVARIDGPHRGFFRTAEEVQAMIRSNATSP